MPHTEFVCPECHTKARSPKPLPDGAAIRCPKCSVVFRLGGASSAVRSAEPKPAAPEPKPAAPKPSAVRPAVAAKSSPALRETRDEAPPPRKSAVASDDRSAVRRRSERDDRDEDDDDRPRRRKSKKAKESSNTPMMLAIGGGAVLVIGLVVAVILVFALKGKDKGTTSVANNSTANNNSSAVNGAPNLTGRPTDSGSRPPSNPPATRPADSTPPDAGTGPVSTAGPAVVGDVYTYVLKSTVLFFNEMKQGIAMGTGTVVDANDRLVLTNYHVVMDSKMLVACFPLYEKGKLISEKERYMSGLQAATKPDHMHISEIVAMAPELDLALVRVPKIPAGVEALPLAKDNPATGQTVHSVGNAGASGAMWVYTQGSVRSVYRKKWTASSGGTPLFTCDSEVIESSSPTNEGDSGGPMVNDRGELVGVTEGYSSAGRAISLFISNREARGFIDREYQRKFGKAWSPVVRAPLRIKAGGTADVTTLINSLDDKDAKTRASAAQSLGEMGPDAKLAIRRLVKALKDSDDLTSRAAAAALAKIGAPGRDDLPALTDALKDPKPEVRRYAAAGIGQIGAEAASAAGALADVLSDADERVREGAVRSLGSLGAGAKSVATPSLTKALKDESKSVRVAAAVAITNLMAPPSADDVPLLLTILKLPDPDASVFGARTLAKLGKQAKSAVTDLLEAAKGGDPAVRRGALDTLAAIGPDAKTAVPIYLAALKDGADSGVRQSALAALGQLGKDLDKDKDKDTIAAVIDATKDADALVKKAALAAVGKLGPVIGPAGAKVVMPALIEAIQDKPEVRDPALETIAGLGPLAKDAVNPLITVMVKQGTKLIVNTQTRQFKLPDEDDVFLTKIAKTLGKIGLPAVGPLRASLNTTNLNVGLLIGSCRALGEIGPPAKTAVRDLQAISQGPFPPPICFEADGALRKIATK